MKRDIIKGYSPHPGFEEGEREKGGSPTCRRNGKGEAVMSKDLLFLCNPKAGKSHIHGEVLELANRLTQLGYRVILRPTQRGGDAEATLAREGMNYALVAVSGGDGTLNEAINGLMALPPEQRPPVLYFPAGSTNDFATTLGIPREPLQAVKAAVGKPFACDMGRMNHRYFTYVAAFGAFTDVAYSTPQKSKNALGHMAYVLEGLKRVPDLRAFSVTVTAGDKTIRDRFVYGMVSNTRSVGGLSLPLPRIELNDGLLEVVLIRSPKTLLEQQMLITKVATGDYTGPLFEIFKAPQVTFSSLEALDWTLDGEFGGSHTIAQVGVCPRAVQFLLREAP